MIRYHARVVVPVSSAPFAEGTVAVEGGRIAYVGPREAAPAGADVHLGDAILAPGLVNTHTHLELTAMRGFLEDLPFRDWILRLTTAKRAALTRADLLDAAHVGIAEGLLAGITTYADTCDSGVAFDAMLEHGVRGIMYQEVFGPDPAQCEASMAELRGKVDALRPRVTSLVAVGISPHAPYTVSDALYRAAAAYARAEALPMAVHIAESAAESDLVERGSGAFAGGLRGRGIAVGRRAPSPIALLEAQEVLAVRPLLIHAVRAGAEDIARIVRHRAPVAHCPISNAKLGHGIAPIAAMLDAGVVVGLGSDSVASNNRMHLLDEAHAAVVMQNASAGRPDALSAATALRLATLDGARALGLEGVTGSLEVGKAADIVAFPLDAPAAVPLHGAEQHLVHALRGHRATLAVVAGEVLVREGRLVRDPAPGARARLEAAAERMQRWLAGVQAVGGPVPPPAATR